MTSFKTCQNYKWFRSVTRVSEKAPFYAAVLHRHFFFTCIIISSLICTSYLWLLVLLGRFKAENFLAINIRSNFDYDGLTERREICKTAWFVLDLSFIQMNYRRQKIVRLIAPLSLQLIYITLTFQNILLQRSEMQEM